MDSTKMDSDDQNKAKTEVEIKQITDPLLKEKCKKLLESIHNYKMNAWAKRRMERIMGVQDK